MSATAKHRARQLRRDLVRLGHPRLAAKILPASRGDGWVDWNYGMTLDEMSIVGAAQNARWPESVYIECLPCWMPAYAAGAGRDLPCVRPGGCPYGLGCGSQTMEEGEP